MSRVTAKITIFVALILVSSQSVFAYEKYATSSAIVSATVVGSSMVSAALIAPADNSATNNSREPLVWRRPSPLPDTPLHHYDLFLDDQLFASSVSDSITTTQSYYFYTVYRSDDTFFLNFNQSLTEGYHYWKVNTYNTAGLSAGTGTWTYYIDSVPPFIQLTKIDRRTLNWNTAIPTSIPDINQRTITATNANPLLSGKVEPYANMQIILMCPSNIPACQNQTYQGNFPTGLWQNRFSGLLRGVIYTVYIQATDAGGNSTTFPEFYLAYGVIAPTPSTTATPVPSVPPEIPPTVVPTPEIEIPPIPSPPVPPVSPTPPIFLTATPVSPALKIENLLIILLVLGLPLHLIMTFYGIKTRFSLILQFLFVLFFPFLGKKEYQTVPFTTLDMFDPDKLDSAWQSKISDIKGFYSLSSPLLNKIFVILSSTGRYWKNIIINGEILPNTCLIPLVEDTKIAQDRLQILSMKYRSLPLLIASLSSAVALVIMPNYFLLIYLYLSLQLVFSEYLYPRLTV